MCIQYARRCWLPFDGKEGGTRCKMHDGVCFVGGAGRAFIGASNCAEPARKRKRPTSEDLGGSILYSKCLQEDI